MLNRLCAIATIFIAILLIAFLGFVQGAFARWDGGSADPKVQAWYQSQTLTPESSKRLHAWFESCCEDGDVCHNCRFQVVPDGSKYGKDEWQYSDDDGKTWEIIPPDIVEREPTPNHEPILFRFPYKGKEIPYGTPVCFKIDDPGI